MRKGSRALPEKYRGIEYSVAKQAEGAWTWKLHPKIERGGAIISGTAKGMNQNAAIEAAHRAIDKMLGTERK